MSDVLVNEKLIADLIAERDKAKKIAHRSTDAVNAAIVTVQRAQEALDGAKRERDEAWRRLRSMNAALGSLGARDHRNLPYYDEEPEDEA